MAIASTPNVPVRKGTPVPVNQWPSALNTTELQSITVMKPAIITSHALTGMDTKGCVARKCHTTVML